MKNLLFTSILVLAFCGAAFAQTSETLPCPTIKVTGPAGLTTMGETMTFTAAYDDKDSVRYEWSVSAGTIIEGQNSPVIRVATTNEMMGVTVTATVKVEGLPENCPNTFSEYAIVDAGCRLLEATDDYGKISPQEEKARLSLVAFRMNAEPTFIALFIINFTKQESTNSIKARVAKISKLMTETHKIAKDKLKFVFSERDIHSTRVYLLPPAVIDLFPDVEENIEKLRPSVLPRKLAVKLKSQK